MQPPSWLPIGEAVDDLDAISGCAWCYSTGATVKSDISILHMIDTLLENVKAVHQQIQADPGKPVQLGLLASSLGDSSNLALMIFVCGLTILPVPFSGMVFSVALIPLTLLMVINHNGVGLPDFVARRTIPFKVADKLMEWLTKLYGVAANATRVRITFLASSHPLMLLLQAPLILLMAFFIFLPMPGGNLGPSGCIIAICLGRMARDGLFVAAGIALGLTYTAIVVGVGFAGAALFT